MTETQTAEREIRASYDDTTVVVYQAYSPHIAGPAVDAQTFVDPFKRERMTWIKPSFLWMMYRSGWATKPGQERILAIRITRAGFEEALSLSSLSSYSADLHGSHEEWRAAKAGSPVRIQWDPERSLDLAPQRHRAIQIGIGGAAVHAYVDEWIAAIEDVTELVAAIRDDLAAGNREAAQRALPVERRYDLPADLAEQVMSAGH